MSAQLDIFFNTSRESGDDLKERKTHNGRQNERIMEAMRVLRTATPSQVMQFLGNNILIGSVRRGMTTLTDNGKLEKTSTQIPGPHKVPEYVWRIPSTPHGKEDHLPQEAGSQQGQ